MKKVLLFLIAILMIGGVVLVGNTIFNSKNIETIEIEGEMQTLYLLNETDFPDFEDAKLKITYKNGSVKYQSMKDVFVNPEDCKSFDTTLLKSSAIMKLVYKSHMIEVPYTVISGGMYYLSSNEKISYVGGKPQVTNSNQYTLTSTHSFIFLDKGGSVKYYQYSNSKSRWHLYDGSKIENDQDGRHYIENYFYEIKGDKLNVHLGSEEPTYQIQANAPSGVMQTYSVKVTKDQNTGLDTGKETVHFKHYDVLTNIRATKVELVCNYLYDSNNNPYLQFERNDTIESSDNEIYLKVTYSNYLIYTDNVQRFKEVYVVVGNGMVKNDTLVTTNKISGYNMAHAELSYESENITLWYKVS